MEKIDLQSLVESTNLKELRLRSLSDVSEFVKTVMDSYDRPQAPVNFDRLMSMGILLANAEHQNVDYTVLRWLLDDPSSKRLDIGAAFLNGLWRRLKNAAPITDDRLDMLLAARRGLEVDDDAEFSFIQVLSQVIESGAAASTKLKALEAVKTAARRNFAAGLRPSVTALVERILRQM